MILTSHGLVISFVKKEKKNKYSVRPLLIVAGFQQGHNFSFTIHLLFSVIFKSSVLLSSGHVAISLMLYYGHRTTKESPRRVDYQLLKQPCIFLFLLCAFLFCWVCVYGCCFLFYSFFQSIPLDIGLSSDIYVLWHMYLEALWW